MEIATCPVARLGEVLGVWARAGAEPTTTDDVDALEALLRHDAEALRVALEQEAIIGTLVTTFDGWRGAFYRMAVLPEFRRCGVATTLLHDGEARLARLGVRRIAIVVVEGHADAAAFWRAAGYTHQPHNLRYVKDL